MATKPSLAQNRKKPVSAEQLRDEIDKCRSMVQQLEEMVRRHSGSMRRD